MTHMSRCSAVLTVFMCVCVILSFGASKSKPHTHQGMLEPYDGKHIPYSLTKEQNADLNNGKPVTINQRNGKSGRGIVIQDIHAPPHICLSKISDLPNYSKVVPNVKSVDIYDNEIGSDGITRIGATFKVGVSFVTFGYFLRLKYDPSYMTYTWTLDYQYSSDFDDNTGHWQAMKHPTKEGWSRVLYSTEVKLFPWIPEFVITFLTKTALIESTTWVKKESEKAAKILVETTGESPNSNTIDLTKCFLEDADGGNARYETHCIDDYVKNLEAKKSPKLVEVEETVTESDSEEEISSEDDDDTSSETESEL